MDLGGFYMILLGHDEVVFFEWDWVFKNQCEKAMASFLPHDFWIVF